MCYAPIRASHTAVASLTLRSDQIQRPVHPTSCKRSYEVGMQSEKLSQRSYFCAQFTDLFIKAVMQSKCL